MRPFSAWIFTGALGFAALTSSQAAAPADAEAARSPVNQVFQFSYSAPSPVRANGSIQKGAVYLWVPETCQKLRGLVIMCTNVPEHMLVGHPAIRKACADRDLGLVWSVPTFWSFVKDVTQKEQVDYLQQLLDGLAQVSGYDEVATVPWLPMGESAHLLMVTGVVDQHPERCIAAVCIKNPQYPKDRSVPMLWTLGTAQEWGQKKADLRLAWLGRRGWGRDATWPLSGAVEPGSGHFYCTDQMARYFGKYIDAAASIRIAADGSLKPVELEQGFLAWLPSPETERPVITAYQASLPDERNRLWFFTEELAREAQEFSKVNWKAQSQMPVAAHGIHCTISPFTFQDSICEIDVATDSEFSFEGKMLDKIPEGFVGAREPLVFSSADAMVAWICGPVAPVGHGKFRIALDRTYKTGAACYLAMIKEGSVAVRYAVQPVAVRLTENTVGAPQRITFASIPDIPADAKFIPLSASSDANLPVDFFVVSGPAIVEAGKLVFTPIPPRAKFPVEVTVAAWQWGSPNEPKIKTAEIVRQTFHILGPKK